MWNCKLGDFNFCNDLKTIRTIVESHNFKSKTILGIVGFFKILTILVAEPVLHPVSWFSADKHEKLVGNLYNFLSNNVRGGSRYMDSILHCLSFLSAGTVSMIFYPFGGIGADVCDICSKIRQSCCSCIGKNQVRVEPEVQNSKENTTSGNGKKDCISLEDNNCCCSSCCCCFRNI